MVVGEGGRFMLSHAAAGDWKKASAMALEDLKPIPPTANVGFIYVTEHFASFLPDIVDAIRNETGVEAWVGAAGAGILVTGREYFSEPALALMVAEFPPESFNLFRVQGNDLNKILPKHGDWISQSDQHFGILHADPRSPSLPDEIKNFVEVTKSFCVGGLTSGSGIGQVAGDVTQGSFSGILLSDDVPVVTALTQGCTPIGPVHDVTAHERNIAIELDGRPAFEVFCEDIGDVLARNLQQAGRYIHAAFLVPGSDRADYVVRNLVGLDPEAGFVAIGDYLTDGQPIMFCRRDRESALQDLRRMLLDLKTRASKLPEGGVYYSCVARGPNLFGRDSEELQLIRDELGEFPLIGFFCNGEISYNRLYSYTGVLSLFL